MTAYYNEFDPKAAAWLRELIAGGHIAAGEVDERSIADVRPEDLRGFTQCHFFAGIGGWSYALRLAGWPDDRPVWTGSPPCQPFSPAGLQKGRNDERHLAPHFAELVAACRPDVLFGEQVASAAVFGKVAKRARSPVDGTPEWAWLDDLFERLEAARYACGATDIPAAGIGAPHIRQRTFFGAARLGEPDRAGREPGWAGGEAARHRGAALAAGGARRLGDDDEGLEGQRGGPRPEGGRDRSLRPVAPAGEPRGLANAACVERECVQNIGPAGLCGSNVQPTERGDGLSDLGTAPLHASTSCAIDSPWRDADWLHCRDGKWRPVEPGTFPLAHGIPGRVGLLRGYGNAIVPQAAAEFIKAFEEARGAV